MKALGMRTIAAKRRYAFVTWTMITNGNTSVQSVFTAPAKRTPPRNTCMKGAQVFVWRKLRVNASPIVMATEAAVTSTASSIQVCHGQRYSPAMPLNASSKTRYDSTKKK